MDWKACISLNSKAIFQPFLQLNLPIYPPLDPLLMPLEVGTGFRIEEINKNSNLESFGLVRFFQYFSYFHLSVHP